MADTINTQLDQILKETDAEKEQIKETNIDATRSPLSAVYRNNLDDEMLTREKSERNCDRTIAYCSPHSDKETICSDHPSPTTRSNTGTARSHPKSTKIDENSTPPKVELKPLPPTLRYEYLGLNETYPVIVNSRLNKDQTEKLLRKLRVHRKAIGYTIDDLTGISPSFCMHMILMEDDHKPSIESQMRLNPNLKEVVKKEIIKLLDAGIIYPISDSK